MKQSVYTLLRICLLKAGPQDLPASRQFLVGCIAAAYVVLFIGYRILIGGNPFGLATAHAVLLGIFWIILLQANRKMDRWNQSASAVYGCTALLNVISLPVIASGLQLAPESGNATLPGSTSIVLVALWIWEIAISARIIRETLEIRLSIAVGLSILLSFALQFIIVSLFGPAS